MTEIFKKNIIPQLTMEQILGGYDVETGEYAGRNESEGGTFLNPRIIGGLIEGATFRSADGGGRVEIMQTYDVGIKALDDAGNEVFKVLVAGTDVGDVIMGSFSDGKYVKWDKSAATMTLGASALVDTRLASTLAGAINATGNFIDSNLDTSAKQILGDFTFGASGAIKMITDVNNGLWLSPTGILGKKAGATTFAIDTSGTAIFAGTLSSASGTFGTITAGTISGVSISGATITGSTLTTGTTGNNVDITSGRISQRYDTTEVVYSDVAANGGWWGFKDIDGNSVFYIDVEGSGTAHSVGFRGAATNSGDWVFQCQGDIIFVGSSGNDIYPSSDNAMSLGLGSNRWSDIRTVLINGADYGFEHKWYLTESYKVGIKEEGIAILNPQNELKMFIGETGLYVKENKIKNLDLLPYTKTTVEQRSQMDRYPEKRNREDEEDKEILKIPDPTKSKIGGSEYVEEKILIKKNK